jgi:hypothetical protein
MSSRRMVMLGGQAESAQHRLRMSMVNGPMGCSGYEGTSSSWHKKEPRICVLTSTELYQDPQHSDEHRGFTALATLAIQW